MNVVVLRYNAGNVQSVLFALERLGVTATLSDEPEVIMKADRVIFPGVGEASSAMNYLKDRKLDFVLKQLNQPILGICLGLQLLCSHSEENDTECLGIFPQQVKKFPAHQKVPHMGWNLLQEQKSPLFQQLPEAAFVYFVHSFYAELGENTIATADYMLPFSAALQKDNYYAVQFHPEKSAAVGAQILQNFLSL